MVGDLKIFINYAIIKVLPLVFSKLKMVTALEVSLKLIGNFPIS